MKDKLMFVLQLVNVVLITCVLGVQIAGLVRTILNSKRSGNYIRI